MRRYTHPPCEAPGCEVRPLKGNALCAKHNRPRPKRPLCESPGCLIRPLKGNILCNTHDPAAMERNRARSRATYAKHKGERTPSTRAIPKNHIARGFTFDSLDNPPGLFGIVVVHDCGWQGGPYLDETEARRAVQSHKQVHGRKCEARGCPEVVLEGRRCTVHRLNRRAA